MFAICYKNLVICTLQCLKGKKSELWKSQKLF